MQAFVDRFKAKASKARQAQSRMKMLSKLALVEVPARTSMSRPSGFSKPPPASPPLVTMDRASVGYEPGKPILTNLSFRFDPEDRVALLGKNGNGKSTMAKLLAGKLQAMAGEFTPARKLVVGYFAQHQAEELDTTVTPILTLQRLRPKLTVEQVRGQLGGFGFTQDKQHTLVGQLSGGERARLMLALATLDRPNLLILDEPTNHLDIDARNELLTALNDFDGAVILVSHDRRLIEATADRLLLVADGHVTPFEGDLDDYRRFLLTGDNAPTRRVEAISTQDAKTGKDGARRNAAEKRQQPQAPQGQGDGGGAPDRDAECRTGQTGQDPVRTRCCSARTRPRPPRYPRSAPMRHANWKRRKRLGSRPAKLTKAPMREGV